MKTKHSTMRVQARRVMPKMRKTALEVTTRKELTLGDLVAAAFDALGDTHDVQRVLGSQRMSRRIGRRLVFA